MFESPLGIFETKKASKVISATPSPSKRQTPIAAASCIPSNKAPRVIATPAPPVAIVTAAGILNAYSV